MTSVVALITMPATLHLFDLHHRVSRRFAEGEAALALVDQDDAGEFHTVPQSQGSTTVLIC